MIAAVAVSCVVLVAITVFIELYRKRKQKEIEITTFEANDSENISSLMNEIENQFDQNEMFSLDNHMNDHETFSDPFENDFEEVL